MTLDLYLAGIILTALIAYALLAGADFGGGVWDLLATGPRAKDQRQVIARAIGPIWEANHVWLIAVIVLLFSCFPMAYRTISNALHVPLTIMLFGIVLRGTAFVFRAYDTQRDDVYQAWSRTFAVASVVTPLMLGVCLGAAVSGRIRLDAHGDLAIDFVEAWWAPFPFAVGAFVVAVFAFLAAVYLTHATDDVELQEAFRARALGAVGVVTVLAWVVFFLAGDEAPHLREGLWSSWWAPGFQLVTAGIGAAIVGTLWTRRYRMARVLAGAQVVGVIGGFGLAQYPHIIYPDVTFPGSAAPDSVLWVVSVGMTVGLVLLAPAYLWLLRLFRDAAQVG